MKKGCGFLLVLWMALAGAYGYVAWQKIHEAFPVAIIAILGGTFASVLVSSFIGLFTGGRDRAALARASNAEPALDGRLEAASGTIRPLGSALEAPFTGRSCVAYEYDVKQSAAGQSDFAGVAMAPCAVDTIRGPVRVLGWAILDEFPRDDIGSDRARGLTYLQSTQFEPLGLTSILSVLTDLLADDDGTIRKDFQIGSAEIRLDGRTITERIIPSGAMVTMLGRWSEEKRGFAPTGPATMNRISPGDLATARKQIGGNSVQAFVIGVCMFLVLHAFLVPIFFLTPAPGATRSGKPASVWDERDCNRQKTLLEAGADPNELGRDGLTPLMNAARMSETACVENLTAAGARLDTTDKDGDSAFAQAVMAGRDENAEALRKAGATDFRVTEADGDRVTGDSPPFEAVKDYIAAVHRGDFATMARLRIGSSVALMEERKADLPFWQSMRPKSFTIAEGWMNANAATLTIRGATPDGDRRVCYQLQKNAEEWRIKNEWFPEPKSR